MLLKLLFLLPIKQEHNESSLEMLESWKLRDKEGSSVAVLQKEKHWYGEWSFSKSTLASGKTGNSEVNTHVKQML